MGLVEMLVFNVGHGNSVYLKMLEKDVMLDCGADENGGFSPSNWLKNKWNVTKLDYLQISHPHIDHIRDILNVDNNFHPKVFSRNRVITEQKIKEENDEVFDTHGDLIKKYLQFDSSYNGTLAPNEIPDSSEWSGGARVVTFSNTDQDMNLNDLSLIAFIQHGNHVVLYGGDLEEKGWNNLLSKKYFTDWLKITNILIASHHGRENGYSSEIFRYCKPQLTIVSDGRFGDTSATSRYSAITSGMTVKKRSGGSETRKVITTRNDGTILFRTNGTEMYVEID